MSDEQSTEQILSCLEDVRLILSDVKQHTAMVVVEQAAELIAELRKENERLSVSLKLIAQMGGLTLLGPSDSDYDGLTNRLPDQYWAHELGAARAFSQAAEVAKEALKDRQ